MGSSALHFGNAGYLMSDADEGDFSTLDFSNRAYETGVSKWGAYVQVAAKRVAYNRFLTGAVYGTAPQITLTRDVLTVSAGVMREIASGWRIAYSVKRRSPEFSSPALNRNDAYQTWGGITLIHDL